jgi:hypothetical protein
MAKATTAVAVKEEKSTAVAVASTFDYGSDAGAGFEETKGSDLSIPFINVLQNNSPKVEAEEAKAGQMFNTVTGELYPEVNFLPVHEHKCFVEWIPRDSGGGFVAIHEMDSDVVKAALAAVGGKRQGKLLLKNGNELIETHYVYGLILEDNFETSKGFGVLSFTSTKIKPKRDWFTSMWMIKGKPPIYAFRAQLKTEKQKNEKGTFYNFTIRPGHPSPTATWTQALINPASPLFLEAKDFRDMVISGVAKAAYETQNAGSGSSPAEGEDGAAPF